MSQSCNLYINPKWNEMEIRNLVERLVGKAEWKSSNMAGYDLLIIPDGYISVFWNCQKPIGSFTLLSRGTQGVELFRKIANCIGGLLEENDCNGKLEFIDGDASESNGLPYFLKHAIAEDGIDPNSIPELIASIEKWGKEVSPHKIIISQDNK